jgi:hypothetical protein
MSPTPWESAIEAPAGFERSTVKASFGSYFVSAATWTVTV